MHHTYLGCNSSGISGLFFIVSGQSSIFLVSVGNIFIAFVNFSKSKLFPSIIKSTLILGNLFIFIPLLPLWPRHKITEKQVISE